MKENPIFVLGFPLGLLKGIRAHVFVRGGVVSRIAELYEGLSSDFTVEAFVFPGNSGGPVLVRPEIIAIKGTKAYPECKLIGIVKSYIHFRKTANSQQPNNSTILIENNTGLTMVETVDSIIQTIEAFEKKFTQETSV